MSKQILIVDDDPNSVRYLSVLLSEHDYQVIAACDGSEGWDQVGQSNPDLIILDMMMPKKSGLVLFQQLKRDERYKEIPILMVTGASGVLQEMEAHEDDPFERPFDSLREALTKKIRELREEGLVRPDMFVDKPVDPDSFIERVQQLIGT